MRPLHPPLTGNHSPLEGRPFLLGKADNEARAKPAGELVGGVFDLESSPHRVSLHLSVRLPRRAFPSGSQTLKGGVKFKSTGKLQPLPVEGGGRGGCLSGEESVGTGLRACPDAGLRLDENKGQARRPVPTETFGRKQLEARPNTRKRDRPPSRLPHRRERGAVPFSMLPFKSDCRIRRSGVAHCSRSRLEDSNS